VVQFVLMFHQHNALSFRAIYAVHPLTGTTTDTTTVLSYSMDHMLHLQCDARCTVGVLEAVVKIYGRGPKQLEGSDKSVAGYLKFETSSKSFKSVHVRGFTASVDAVILDASNCNMSRGGSSR